MKRLMIVCLALALALAACAPASDPGTAVSDPGASASDPGTAVSDPGTPASDPGTAWSDPNRAYALEKLNEINDMVLDRQMVPGDYLRYLDGALAEKVEEYNSALVNAKGATVKYAKHWADLFRNISPEDDAAYASYGRYLEEGDNYFRFIEEFSAALLYPNPMDLTFFGTVVGWPAGCESGGSGGLWASGYYLDESQRYCIDTLTTTVDELLDQFDNARAGRGQGT